MTRTSTTTNAVPEWFRETFQVLRHVTGGIRDIEIKLRDALSLQGLDPRLRSEIENVLDALAVVKVSLSVMDMTADGILEQIKAGKPSDPQATLA